MRVTVISAPKGSTFASFAIFREGSKLESCTYRDLVGECRLFGRRDGTVYDWVVSDIPALKTIRPEVGDDFAATVKKVEEALKAANLPFRRND